MAIISESAGKERGAPPAAAEGAAAAKKSKNVSEHSLTQHVSEHSLTPILGSEAPDAEAQPVEPVKRKRGRPRSPPKPKVQVQRPIHDGQRRDYDKWDGKSDRRPKFDGRFKSVEPLKSAKRTRGEPYKWNHRSLITWIMGQADPAGFLSSVMVGREVFPVYARDEDGNVAHIGKISADPELRVLAAKTLLGKCVPDLKAVEINATIEENKTVDISRLSTDDLTAIERVLEHAVIDVRPSGDDETLPQDVRPRMLANNRAGENVP